MRVARGMSRSIYVGLLTCSALSAQNEVHRVRNIVLVHGAWADGSGWKGVTADGIDAATIQKVVAPPKGEKWGSLKSLEKLIALKASPEKARALLGPLVGIYELRHADAHLAGSDIDEAFVLARVDRTQPFVFQGYHLLNSCVSSLFAILEVFRELPDKSN
jgi:hypothetical protein